MDTERISGKDMLEIIKKRQSDRGYFDREVEQWKLDRILEAGRLAPSACNSQPWKFIVVNEPGLKKEVARAATSKELGFNKFVDQAPILLVIVKGKGKVISRVGSSLKDKEYSRIDIGIATASICLQATAEGLGTCILGWFDEEMVKSLLGIPGQQRVELIITLGYSSKPYRQKQRKGLSEIITYNKY